MSDLLKFDKMITPVIIQVIYYLGLLVVVLAALASLFGGQLLGAILILVFGPLITRMYCEIFMVIFKVHETLQEIRDSVRSRP